MFRVVRYAKKKLIKSSDSENAEMVLIKSGCFSIQPSRNSNVNHLQLSSFVLHLPCVMTRKSFYTLGSSLTDPSDISEFLVLVSSHDSQAAAHHLLEFRRSMSSYHGERVATAQSRQVGMWVRLPNRGPFAVGKNLMGDSLNCRNPRFVDSRLDIKSVSSPACSMRQLCL